MTPGGVWQSWKSWMVKQSRQWWLGQWEQRNKCRLWRFPAWSWWWWGKWCPKGSEASKLPAWLIGCMHWVALNRTTRPVHLWTTSEGACAKGNLTPQVLWHSGNLLLLQSKLLSSGYFLPLALHTQSSMLLLTYRATITLRFTVAQIKGELSMSLSSKSLAKLFAEPGKLAWMFSFALKRLL